MGIFDKKDDKPSESKPDFSNVRSGGSSTASAPQPTGTLGLGKTYIVVNGDSLSKIAKREYADANTWGRGPSMRPTKSPSMIPFEVAR